MSSTSGSSGRYESSRRDSTPRASSDDANLRVRVDTVRDDRRLESVAGSPSSTSSSGGALPAPGAIMVQVRDSPPRRPPPPPSRGHGYPSRPRPGPPSSSRGERFTQPSVTPRDSTALAHSRDIVGKVTTQPDGGALPYCKCKKCERSLMRNLNIVEPTRRQLPYMHSGRETPTFYRMGLGTMEAPLLHSLDDQGFQLDENITLGHYPLDFMIDPAVGCHLAEVSLFKLKIGLYHYMRVHFSPITAEIWALLSTVYERNAQEIKELLEVRCPTLCKLHSPTLGEVETELIKLAAHGLAFSAKYGELPKPIVLPRSFATFVAENLEDADDVILYFIENTLAQLRHYALIQVYTEEKRSATSLMGRRNIERLHTYLGRRYGEKVHDYLFALFGAAWKEVRDGDDIKIPIFQSEADIRAMFNDLERGKQDFVLRIVDKPLVSGKKRVFAAISKPAADDPQAGDGRGGRFRDEDEEGAGEEEEEEEEEGEVADEPPAKRARYEAPKPTTPPLPVPTPEEEGPVVFHVTGAHISEQAQYEEDDSPILGGQDQGEAEDDGEEEY